MSSLKRSDEFGIEVDGYNQSGEALYNRKNKVVETLVGGVEQLVSSYPNIHELSGTASIKDKNTVTVDLHTGETEEIEVDNIIIDTESTLQKTEKKGVELKEKHN